MSKFSVLEQLERCSSLKLLSTDENCWKIKNKNKMFTAWHLYQKRLPTVLCVCVCWRIYFCWFHQIVPQQCKTTCLYVSYQFRGKNTKTVKAWQGLLVLCPPQIKVELPVNSASSVCSVHLLLNVSCLTSFNGSKCSIKGLYCLFKILDQLKRQLLGYLLNLNPKSVWVFNGPAYYALLL